MNFRTTNILFTTLALLGCGVESKNDVSDLTDIHSGAGGFSSLGLGFDSLKGESTGTRCFDQLPTRKMPLGEGRLEFHHDLSSEELMDKMAGNLEISVPIYPGITAKGGVGFSTDYGRTDFSETYVMHYHAKVEQERIYIEDALDNTLKINPAVRRMLDDKSYTEAEKRKALNAMCGDQFVTSVDRGMNLVAVLKINFASSQDKRSFSGMLGAEILGGVGDIEVTTTFEKEKISRETAIELAVFQQGGDSTGLLDAFNAEDCQGDQCIHEPFLQCGYDTRHVCIDAYRRVIAYANRSARNPNFSEKLAPLRVVTDDYPLGGISELVKPSQAIMEQIASNKEELIKQRRKYLRLYSQISFERSRLNDIKNKFGLFITAEYKSKLEATIAQNDQAVDLAAKSYQLCWADKISIDDPEGSVASCSEAVNTLSERFLNGDLKIDNKVLSPQPQTFVEWCLLASSRILLDPSDKLSYQKIESYIKDQLRCNNTKTCIPGIDLELNLNDKDVAEWLQSNDNLDSIFGNASVDGRKQFCGLLHDTVNTKEFNKINLDFDYESGEDYKISSLSPLRSMRYLEYLSAKNNQIETINGLEALNLKELDLANNKFSDPSALVDLPWKSLDSLSLARNGIYEMDGDLSFMAVKSLDLSGNPWDTLNGVLRVSPELEDLYLEGIDLQELSIEGGVDLKVGGFDCSGDGPLVCLVK